VRPYLEETHHKKTGCWNGSRFDPEFKLQKHKQKKKEKAFLKLTV
jgi:hypothetical protein